MALSRGERFRGRALFSGMLYAPLVMPEVITGLSLLLLFVALNAERGFWTVTIAHTTLTMCFVAVVVQSRLAALDRSLEEAAMDLGCDPVQAFLAVTLPLIMPAIAAGWMLAFTLSLDDVVIASFTTGPGSATLPIRIYSEVRLGVKPRDQRDLHAGARVDRGGDRGGVARLEAVELRAARARRRCRSVMLRWNDFMTPRPVDGAELPASAMALQAETPAGYGPGCSASSTVKPNA